MKKKGQPSPPPETPAEEVLAATKINPLALDDGFIKISAQLATFNERFYEALRTHLRAKAELDRTWARLYLAIREELKDADPKTTEATIKASVDSHDEYFAARMAAAEAEAEKSRLWGVLDALRAKKDALISLGANARAEMSGMPGIRGERRGARDVEGNFDKDEAFDVEIG